ncbi:MAG TPA: hypothetical protein DCR27_12825 [Lachnospiraceae bacterium]|nr:hypothetical protein [Lachnospiraceae bacterium]
MFRQFLLFVVGIVCYTSARACLKNRFRRLRILLCVIFVPNAGYIARYAPFIWRKSSTNCDVHLAETFSNNL